MAGLRCLDDVIIALHNPTCTDGKYIGGEGERTRKAVGRRPSGSHRLENIRHLNDDDFFCLSQLKLRYTFKGCGNIVLACL